MKVFVLGSTGMIGSSVFMYLSRKEDIRCTGFARSRESIKYLPSFYHNHMRFCGDLNSTKTITEYLKREKPDVLINCSGITKHLPESADKVKCVKLNSMLPHILANSCSANRIKLIQISTDCVFSGSKGNYKEDDIPDALDFYGKSKYLGEVDYNHHLTIRTSTIGHELNSRFGLLEWFLAQKSCKGFKRAIFSGLTTLELSRFIYNVALTNTDIHGMYHVSSVPIDKYSLLKLISKHYKNNVSIQLDNDFVIDRSLNSEKLYKNFAYKPPSWEDMISNMHSYHLN